MNRAKRDLERTSPRYIFPLIFFIPCLKILKLTILTYVMRGSLKILLGKREREKKNRLNREWNQPFFEDTMTESFVDKSDPGFIIKALSHKMILASICVQPGTTNLY